MDDLLFKSKTMGKIQIFLLSFFISVQVIAQDSPYQFETLVDLDATPVKDQCMTGTCWSFSTISFVESELLRMGKGEHNLSEMFNVRMTYPKKIENYIRYQGKAQFGPGSLCHDVMNVIEDYGMVPDEVYSGLDEGEEIHNHGEMDMVLDAMVKAISEKNKGRMSDDTKEALEAVLDAYLGEVPEKFEYQAKEYTPMTFKEEMGINPDDYVSLTSFTHHDFYEEFVLEVPDNFAHESFYNVTLDDLFDAAKNALENGYTIAWDADVSENGFSFRNGMAIVPAEDLKREEMFDKVVEEKDVTQEMRQEGFDNFSTTDDHLMHLTGIAEDQNGKLYFVMKNSWGTGNLFGGKQYVSAEYFKMKSISIMIHKDALSKELRKKLGI